VPVTRQNAGTSAGCGEGKPPAPTAFGGVNGPAGTSSASSLVSGNDRPASAPHAPLCACADIPAASPAASTAAEITCFMVPPTQRDTYAVECRPGTAARILAVTNDRCLDATDHSAAPLVNVDRVPSPHAGRP